MRKIFFHGIISGILTAISGIIYLNIYQNTLGADFHKVVNYKTISAGSIFGCLLIALAFWILEKINKNNLRGWLNVVISIVSFASIIVPVSMSLPLDIQNPELFPGLAIPLHFFPALAYLAIAPFFDDRN